jgi:hypothetical protein
MFLPQDVEISDEVFIIRREDAERYKSGAATVATPPRPSLGGPGVGPDAPPPPGVGPKGPATVQTVPRLTWKGQVSPQKWMNFYTKVLSRFATGPGMQLTVHLEVAPPDGIPVSKVEDTKMALRELGLKDSVEEEL